MESDLKRGIEIRKSIRMPTKRMAPAPPMRDGTGDGSNFASASSSSKPEQPPTSLRQLLGDDDKRKAAVVPPPQPMMEVSGCGGGSASANASSSVDKRQLAVRTDGGGITAAPTKLVVDDGVHELNLKNLQIATAADNNQAQNKVISGPQKTIMAPPPVITARKMAPLSPSLVRKISTLHQGKATDKVSCPRAGPGGDTAGHPIKLSDLDGLVPRRDYVNQEAATAVVCPAATTTAIPEDLPLTSIDVLNQIQMQITNMEVKHHEQSSNSGEQAVEDSMENVSHYKERIKMSKRYGEKEELSLKHGRSDVASNQLLGYLGDYRDNVRPNTGTDDENDHGSEDESSHSPFQRGSSVRKSTGGAVSMAKTTMAGGTTHGKGKPVSRTASDTKNLETKIKMMRESTANHGPIDSKPPTSRRAKPVTAKLPFSFKPRILDMNEKHLVHQVTPPSAVNAPGAKPNAGHHIEDHNHQQQKQPHPPSTRMSHSPSVQPRVQSVQSHSKKFEQVMFVWGPRQVSGSVRIVVFVSDDSGK